MYLTQELEKIWAGDIEGNDLLTGLTHVWCLCLVNMQTQVEVRLRKNKIIGDWRETAIPKKNKIFFHNGIGYDAPALNKIVGPSLNPSHIIDTLVMSMVYSPSGNIAGVHGHALD